MSPDFWLTLTGSFGLSTLVPLLVKLFQDRQRLKAAAPRADADASASSIEAQGKTLDRLVRENDRLNTRLSSAEARIESLSVQLRAAEDQMAQQARTLERVEGLLGEHNIPVPSWFRRGH